MEKQIKCNNGYCPINRICQNFSTNDEQFDLESYEFEIGTESDEQEVQCDKYIPIDLF
jgi:hypothetical protein